MGSPSPIPPPPRSSSTCVTPASTSLQSPMSDNKTNHAKSQSRRRRRREGSTTPPSSSPPTEEFSDQHFKRPSILRGSAVTGRFPIRRRAFVILFASGMVTVILLSYSFCTLLSTSPSSSPSSHETEDKRASLSRQHVRHYLQMQGNTTSTQSEKISFSSKGDALAAAVSPHKAKLWLAGIIQDASQLQPSTMKYLVQLSCNLNVSISIVASKGTRACLASYREVQEQLFMQRANKESDAVRQECAPFVVEREPSDIASMPMRVDRIAIARDYQRDRLRQKYFSQDSISDQDVIMIADLDLYRLPDLSHLSTQLEEHFLTSNVHEKRYDALCATGIMHRPYGYYDIFATVYWNDTFLYPIRGRFIRHHYFSEVPSLVRSNDMYGKRTQWDILSELQQASDAGAHPVEVRSCFGGFTIYRARTWLDEQCRYWNNVTEGHALMRYASRNSKRPCEHVVFHDCLHRRGVQQDENSAAAKKEETDNVRLPPAISGKLTRASSSFSIAVQPLMQTEWNERIPFKNVLKPTDRHSALGVFAKHPTEGDMLQNGNYTLRILPQEGRLVLEEGYLNAQMVTNTVWKSPIMSEIVNNGNKHEKLLETDSVEVEVDDVTYWTHMFLMLKETEQPSDKDSNSTDAEAELILVKQVPISLLEKHGSYLCARQRKIQLPSQGKKHRVSLPCDCDGKIDNCKITVWSSLWPNAYASGDGRWTGTNAKLETTPLGASSPLGLVLSEKGDLYIESEMRTEWIWSVSVSEVAMT